MQEWKRIYRKPEAVKELKRLAMDGARVIFSREVMDWLLSNRVPTTAEFVEAKEVEFTNRKR